MIAIIGSEPTILVEVADRQEAEWLTAALCVFGWLSGTSLIAVAPSVECVSGNVDTLETCAASYMRPLGGHMHVDRAGMVRANRDDEQKALDGIPLPFLAKLRGTDADERLDAYASQRSGGGPALHLRPQPWVPMSAAREPSGRVKRAFVDTDAIKPSEG
jgi:hypothetical protein